MDICFFRFMVASLISSLAAMVLQFALANPCLIVMDQKDAETDLVIGDIVWDLAGLPSLSYPFGACAWLSKAQQSCIPATALFFVKPGFYVSSVALYNSSLTLHNSSLALTSQV